MKRPNVLILYTDQQRWDTIEGAGFDYMHTPNINRLVKSGVVFNRAYCNSPVCMPSRQSMLSGQYPSSIGSTCNGIEMREDVATLPTYLKPYGYVTANIGKLHFINHAHRDHRDPHPSYGFDHCVISDEPGCYNDAYIKWVAEKDESQIDNCRTNTPPAHKKNVIDSKPGRNTHEPYLFEGPEYLTHTAFVGEETCQFIRDNAHKHFAAIAGFYAPHPPNNPPEQYVKLYENKKITLPSMNQEDNVLGLSDADWLKVKKYYYAMISQVDEYVGRILDTLEELKILEDTLIIFTSDHGENLGDHGLVQKGPPGFDSCMRVPLVVSYGAKIKSQKIRNELVEAVDILPTILDYCGVQLPTILQGMSLRGLLSNKDQNFRDSVYFEYKVPFEVSWKGIRTDQYKYCRNQNGEEYFFDLLEDPHELQNLAKDSSQSVFKIQMQKKLLDRWFQVESQHPLRTGQY